MLFKKINARKLPSGMQEKLKCNFDIKQTIFWFCYLLSTWFSVSRTLYSLCRSICLYHECSLLYLSAQYQLSYSKSSWQLHSSNEKSFDNFPYCQSDFQLVLKNASPVHPYHQVVGNHQMSQFLPYFVNTAAQEIGFKHRLWFQDSSFAADCSN